MFKSRNKENCNSYNGDKGNTRMQIVFFPLTVELFAKNLSLNCRLHLRGTTLLKGIYRT